MNRRRLLKLLGQATVVSGIALVAGLPEVSIKDDPIEAPPDKVTSDYVGSGKIEKWDGNTWSSLGPPNTQVNQLYINADGVVYVGGELVE